MQLCDPCRWKNVSLVEKCLFNSNAWPPSLTCRRTLLFHSGTSGDSHELRCHGRAICVLFYLGHAMILVCLSCLLWFLHSQTSAFVFGEGDPASRAGSMRDLSVGSPPSAKHTSRQNFLGSICCRVRTDTILHRHQQRGRRERCAMERLLTGSHF